MTEHSIIICHLQIAREKPQHLDAVLEQRGLVTVHSRQWAGLPEQRHEDKRDEQRDDRERDFAWAAFGGDFSFSCGKAIFCRGKSRVKKCGVESHFPLMNTAFTQHLSACIRQCKGV